MSISVHACGPLTYIFYLNVFGNVTYFSIYCIYCLRMFVFNAKECLKCVFVTVCKMSCFFHALKSSNCCLFPHDFVLLEILNKLYLL